MDEQQQLITPKTQAAPEVEPAEPAKEPKSDLPDDLLKVPAIQAIFAGKPPAVSAPIAEFTKRPEAKLIADNKDPLFKAGIGLYRSLSGDLGVLFNQFYIHGEDIKAADQAGRLQEIAPPFDAINAQIGQSGANHPALMGGQPPSGLASPSIQPAPPVSVPPAASGIQQKIVANRNKEIQPGAPTQGPRPGAGRLLNSILKPVI